MTTPPLDLPALRSDVLRAPYLSTENTEHPWEHFDPDHAIEAIDRAIAAEKKVAAVEALFGEYHNSGSLAKAAIRAALDGVPNA